MSETPATIDDDAPSEVATQHQVTLSSPVSGRDFFAGFAAEVINSKVMIVDDEPLNVRVLRKYLETVGFTRFVTTSDALQSLQILEEENPDILLLDIMMPGISGLDILEIVREHSQLKFLPVIILTAASDPDTKLEALCRGATEFLGKPVEHAELALRVRNALVAKGHQDRLADYSTYLKQQVSNRTAQLRASQQEVVNCLARAADYRDGTTGSHVIRVGLYAEIVAREMGCPHHIADLIREAAKLHDVGKIGIPDSILLKPGKLDAVEKKLMQQHCSFGRNIIEQLPDGHLNGAVGLAENVASPILRLAASVAYSHHERWDGGGYPLGLSGSKIPIEGRITAIADVFDALSTKRPYKDAFEMKHCFQILEEGRGTHFDPEVLDAFFSSLEQIMRVYKQYSDDIEEEVAKAEKKPVAKQEKPKQEKPKQKKSAGEVSALRAKLESSLTAKAKPKATAPKSLPIKTESVVVSQEPVDEDETEFI